jgi:hypothetical protein
MDSSTKAVYILLIESLYIKGRCEFKAEQRHQD